MSWFNQSTKIKCNNIWYNLPKKGGDPVIGVCLDGTGPNHLTGAKMPNFWSGIYRDAHAFLPTVTNTNNVSIVTGVAPSVHGVVANTIIESKTAGGRERGLGKWLADRSLFRQAIGEIGLDDLWRYSHRPQGVRL